MKTLIFCYDNNSTHIWSCVENYRISERIQLIVCGFHRVLRYFKGMSGQSNQSSIEHRNHGSGMEPSDVQWVTCETYEELYRTAVADVERVLSASVVDLYLRPADPAHNAEITPFRMNDAYPGNSIQEQIATYIQSNQSTVFAGPEQPVCHHSNLVSGYEVSITGVTSDTTLVALYEDGPIPASDRVTVRKWGTYLSHILAWHGERHCLEQEILTLKAELDTLHHELRTPLNVALGRTDAARERFQSTNLHLAMTALERMVDILDSPPDVFRPARINKEFVSIHEVATLAFTHVNPGSSVLRNKIDPSIQIEGDRRLLLHFFENIFSNSIEHTPGDVRILVDECPDGFYIADTGPGMSYQPSVEDAESPGLGLFLVRNIARLHGWQISMDESFEGGFRIDISI